MAKFDRAISPHLFAAGLIAFSALLTPCRGASGNDFTLNLKVQAGRREQTAVSRQAPSARPVFTVKAQEVVQVQWSAANAATSSRLSDVTLHVFLDHGDARSDAPKPGPKVLFESALIQDFDPGGKSSGEFRMQMPGSGSYVLRAETIGAAKKLGKEVAASMQVVVP